MKRLLLAGALALSMQGAQAQGIETFLTAWAATVAVGGAVAMCTAQVLGDTYQSWCEAQGGSYVFRGNGDSWKCYLPDAPERLEENPYEGVTIRECVVGLFGPD